MLCNYYIVTVQSMDIITILMHCQQKSIPVNNTFDADIT